MDEDPARPAACVDSAGLSELASRLGQVEEQLAGFNRSAAHRESVIDQLHEENQLLKAGLNRKVLEPVVTDLIRLHDQLSQEARRQAGSGQDARLAESFADEVEQILARCGMDMITAVPGEPFDVSRHHPLAMVPCADEAQHNTVAEVTAAGFIDRETGHLRRPLQARFYQYQPEPQDVTSSQ
jgi:molecular chaperone GrpE (heat shock protein)